MTSHAPVLINVEIWNIDYLRHSASKARRILKNCFIKTRTKSSLDYLLCDKFTELIASKLACLTYGHVENGLPSLLVSHHISWWVCRRWGACSANPCWNWCPWLTLILGGFWIRHGVFNFSIPFSLQNHDQFVQKIHASKHGSIVYYLCNTSTGTYS